MKARYESPKYPHRSTEESDTDGIEESTTEQWHAILERMVEISISLKTNCDMNPNHYADKLVVDGAIHTVSVAVENISKQIDRNTRSVVSSQNVPVDPKMVIDHAAYQEYAAKERTSHQMVMLRQIQELTSAQTQACLPIMVHDSKLIDIGSDWMEALMIARAW